MSVWLAASAFPIRRRCFASRVKATAAAGASTTVRSLPSGVEAQGQKSQKTAADGECQIGWNEEARLTLAAARKTMSSESFLRHFRFLAPPRRKQGSVVTRSGMTV